MTYRSRTFIVLVLCSPLLGWATVSSADKKKFDDPGPRKEAILKLFVEEFVPITPGKGKYPETFVMGSEKGGDDNERPAHKVTFKYSFAMAKHEVTQELYQVIMGKNPARWPGPRNSVEMVNFGEAEEFCTKVAKELRQRKLIEPKDTVRLPSEAEWEYCCRAGTKTAYSCGDDVKELGKYAWFKDNAPGNDPPVGQKLPNAWGLYDMHGYVREWCQDDWYKNYDMAPTDGSARKVPGSKEHVARGGGYPDSADKLRSAYRQPVGSEVRSDALGLRCVLTKE